METLAFLISQIWSEFLYPSLLKLVACISYWGMMKMCQCVALPSKERQPRSRSGGNSLIDSLVDGPLCRAVTPLEGMVAQSMVLTVEFKEVRGLEVSKVAKESVIKEVISCKRRASSSLA